MGGNGAINGNGCFIVIGSDIDAAGADHFTAFFIKNGNDQLAVRNCRVFDRCGAAVEHRISNAVVI